MAFGVLTYAWINRDQQPSVKFMLLSDLLSLPMMSLIAGMFFTVAEFRHSGDFTVVDAALGLFCAAGAVVVARRIVKRMPAGVENPSFRAAEQTMLEDISEMVKGLQAEKAIPKAA